MTIATHRLTFPLTAEVARTLHAGDQVTVDGEILVTAGLPTHQRLLGCLDGKEPFPMPMHGRTLFHLGSYAQEREGDAGEGGDGGSGGGAGAGANTSARDGTLEILYINPTTSTRFNPLMPRLIRELDLHAIGGKGGLDAECVKAMQETGCVYLSFLGGGATLHTRAIREVLEVGWSDMLMHYRLVRLRVEGLGPLTVAIDAHGHSTYADATAHARTSLDEIMKAMDAERAASVNARAG